MKWVIVRHCANKKWGESKEKEETKRSVMIHKVRIKSRNG